MVPRPRNTLAVPSISSRVQPNCIIATLVAPSATFFSAPSSRSFRPGALKASAGAEAICFCSALAWSGARWPCSAWLRSRWASAWVMGGCAGAAVEGLISGMGGFLRPPSYPRLPDEHQLAYEPSSVDVDTPRRTVYCEDALAWLRAQPVLAGCSFITSLPDASELPAL